MTTAQLIDQLDAYLKPTKPGQYAVVVSRRFLVALKRHLEENDSQKPAAEQTEHIGLAVAVPVES